MPVLSPNVGCSTPPLWARESSRLRHRRPLRRHHVPAALQVTGVAAQQHHRQRIEGVDVGVAHTRAPQQQRVVEQRAVAVRDRLQPGQVLADQLRVVGVGGGVLLDPLLLVLVVGDGMVRLGDAEVRIGPAAQLAAQHEGEDAGDVGLEGDGHQVEHQPDVIAVVVGDADRRIGRRDRRGVLPLGALEAELDLADVLQVVVHAATIGGGQPSLQLPRLAGHHVQDAAAVAQPRGALLRRAEPAAEHALEHEPRVELHRQRLRRRPPGDGVEIGAAEADLARPDLRREVFSA